jgi:hypothetical protein
MSTIPPPRYFLMRQRRDGPLVPARLWWCDHDPADPDNKLDRGYSPYPRADIAGLEVDPQHIFDRTMSQTDLRPGVPATHWKYPQPITETEYRYQFERMRWAERNAPQDPTLRPKAPVDPRQAPLPDFNRENAL